MTKGIFASGTRSAGPPRSAKHSRYGTVMAPPLFSLVDMSFRSCRGIGDVAAGPSRGQIRAGEELATSLRGSVSEKTTLAIGDLEDTSGFLGEMIYTCPRSHRKNG